MCCPPRIISEFAQVTHAKRLFLKTTSEEPALLMPYWYPRAKQPAKCKSSYPSELHQMTENTQLCMTWVGGRVGHKDEQTISSCFTNRFSARDFIQDRAAWKGSYASSRRNLRQSSTTCRFHTDPSALSKKITGPITDPASAAYFQHPAFGPVCRSLSESTHPTVQKSRATDHFCFERQLPIVWLSCTARVSGITAMLKSDGSKSVSAFLPLLLFCICPVARTHCTAWWDDGTGLG